MPLSFGFGETAKMKKRMRMEITRRSRRLVSKAQDNLFRDTPKDTQWAASNWIINLGSPHTHTSRSKADVSYDEARSSKQMLSGWDPFKQNAYLSNNVPYIGMLDAGWGGHPVGFVQAAIDRATAEENASR